MSRRSLSRHFREHGAVLNLFDKSPPLDMRTYAPAVSGEESGWVLLDRRLWGALQIQGEGYTFPYLAHLYAALDDEPHAVSYLERAYEEHNLAVLFIRTAPELDSIRSSPRFRDLVRRIGFPQH